MEPNAYEVTNKLTNMTTSNTTVYHRYDGVTVTTDYSATLKANDGYQLPENISVKVGATELTKGTGYTYDSTSGALKIFAASITGDIEIEGRGVPIHNVTVQKEGNGTAYATPTSGIAGTEITLSATPDSGWRLREWQIVSGDIRISNNKFTMPDSDVVVRAIFEDMPSVPEEATVKFDPAGGKWSDETTAPKTVTAYVDTEITILEAPTREGYEFQYWEGSVYQPGEKFTVPVDGHTFTAVWVKAAPTDPTGPTETTTPTDPTDPTETTKPTDPTDPTETTKPTDPTDPTETTKPTDLGDPTETTTSTDPATPKTGESMRIYLWLSLLPIAAGALLIVLRKKRILENRD